ncbi:MAG: SLC13 family permease [Micrococcus sp.]|nr:SLC13 family permease [Micrococcus sp.]
MTALNPAAAWNALWRSHDQTKDLLTLKVLRRETAASASGDRVGATATSKKNAAASSGMTGKGAGKAADGGGTTDGGSTPAGPAYTPAKLTGLILGPLLFIIFQFIFAPEGLSPEGRSVLAVTLWVATWWITEAIPIPATSLLPIVLLPLTGAMTGSDVVSAYGNDTIFLFLGGFAIAIALEKWNLHQRIALNIVSALGVSPKRIILGFMVATAFLSMWVSNTAATMMMIPVGLAVAHQAAQSLRGAEHQRDLHHFEKAILFGIAYAATIGGLGTLIGTPPLAILAATSADLAGETIGFAQWMVVGVPVVVVLLALTWLYMTNISFKVKLKQLPGGAEVIREQRRGLGRMSPQEIGVGIVFVFAAFMWITRTFLWQDIFPSLTDGMIAVVATTLLFLIPARATAPGEKKPSTRLLEWEDSVKIPWGILLLFGGGLAIAAGFTQSGLSEWIGEQLLGLQGMNSLLIIIVATALVLALTEITSNTATATMILPVMAAFAVSVGLHPFALMVPAAMAANCAFMLPVGTPPNAVLFATGKVKITEMVRVGFALNIIALVLLLAAVLLIMPAAWGIDVLGTN